MCVLSVGLDVVDVAEFAALLGQPGTDFAGRVFGRQERAAADELPGARRDQHLAARFAAKEAFVKAWSAALADGTPLLPETETWAGIVVRSDAYGRPGIELAEPVASAVSRSLGDVRTAVSLSHEASVASAVVVLSRPHPATAADSPAAEPGRAAAAGGPEPPLPSMPPSARRSTVSAPPVAPSNQEVLP